MTKLALHGPLVRAATAVIGTYLAAYVAGSTGCGRLEEHAWKSHKKPPRVAFDHVTYQLGDVRQGKVVQHDFPFQNLGDLDLTVDRTRSTSECAVSLPTGRTVRPSGRGVVRAELNTANQGGTLRRTITVYTNDPHKRTVLLTLVANVIADAVVNPKTMYVGPVTRGSVAPTSFTVTIRRKSLRVGAPAADNPYVTVVPKTSPDGGKTIQLEVRVAEDAPFGPFDQIIRLPIDDSTQRALQLRIAGIVQPNVTAAPNRLTFDKVPRNETMVRQLLVRNRGPGPVRITAAEWNPRLGSVEIDTLRKGRRYRIRAILDGNLAPGDLTSTIQLTTDDPEQPRIEIPVAGHVVETAPHASAED